MWNVNSFLSLHHLWCSSQIIYSICLVFSLPSWDLLIWYVHVLIINFSKIHNVFVPFLHINIHAKYTGVPSNLHRMMVNMWSLQFSHLCLTLREANDGSLRFLLGRIEEKWSGLRRGHSTFCTYVLKVQLLQCLITDKVTNGNLKTWKCH